MYDQLINPSLPSSLSMSVRRCHAPTYQSKIRAGLLCIRPSFRHTHSMVRIYLCYSRVFKLIYLSFHVAVLILSPVSAGSEKDAFRMGGHGLGEVYR